MTKYAYTKEKNDYLTPPELVKLGLQLISNVKGTASIDKFDCDVCCSIENIPALHYYRDGETDGLITPWKLYNWCNPPFDECIKWVAKAYYEQQIGNTSVLLIPVRTECKYWHDYILYNKNVQITWLKKGFRFLNADSLQPMGVFKNALALVLFKGVVNE